MKKKILILLIGLVLCVGAAFGIENLLVYSYRVDLNQVQGLTTEGDDDHIVFRLDQLEGMNGSQEEALYEEEFYDEEFYDESFDEEFYDEAYEEPVYQLSFTIKGKPSGLWLQSWGNEGGQILAVTPEGETEFYLEQSGSSKLYIPVTTQDAPVTIQFTDPSQIIESIQVELSEGFNAERMLVLAVALYAVFMLLVLRQLVAEHIEYGFLIVGTAVMLLMAILIPVNSWWDEDVHYYAAESVSRIPGDLFSGKDLKLILSETGINAINYSFSALSMLITRLLNLPANAAVLLDRALNGILYLSVCFIAIRVIKRYKRSLTVIALLPLALFTGISYSYDVSINAFSFLAFALITNEFCTPHEKLKLKNAAWIAVSLVIASLPKAVYIPFILLMLFLPAGKFTSKKQHIAYKAGVVMVFLMVMLAFLVPMLYNPMVYIDARGSGDESSSQITFILNNLGKYISLLFTTIWNNFGVNFMESPNFLAFLNGGSHTLNLLALLFMVFVCFTDNDHEVKAAHPTILQKGMTGLAALGVMMLIYTVFYVAFSEIGGNAIEGVQGRYFLPLFPFIACVIQPRSVENRMNKSIYHPAILTVSLIISVTLIFSRVLSRTMM